jgi:hypothetical protein
MKLNLPKFTAKFLFLIIFFFITSLFFSNQKIIVVLILSLIFFLVKIKYQKIVIINLLIFITLLKISIYPFQQKIDSINPSKTSIYEKHFLYGLRNVNFTIESFNGDLSSLDKNLKIKYRKNNNPKKIRIISDELGFRNKIKADKADYIFVGDSFLHLGNITQEKTLNYILNNKYNLKTYNAGLGSTDISHYFETIKFFKDMRNFNNKKYVMFIFQGNDFLDYNVNKKNTYHKYIENSLLHSYYKIKVFFNFYRTIKFFSYSINKSNDNFKKVFEYKVANQNVLFKFDYIYEKENEIKSLNNLFIKYKNYLPDIIVFIPTKYEVYCKFIKNSTCVKTKHFSVINNNKNLNGVKILDANYFFKNQANLILQKNNDLLYEVDDTHLSETGVNFLSKIISQNLSN